MVIAGRTLLLVPDVCDNQSLLICLTLLSRQGNDTYFSAVVGIRTLGSRERALTTTSLAILQAACAKESMQKCLDTAAGLQ